MAWCCQTPCNYLYQHWLIKNEVLWHSVEGNFACNLHGINKIEKTQNHLRKERHTLRIYISRGNQLIGIFFYCQPCLPPDRFPGWGVVGRTAAAPCYHEAHSRGSSATNNQPYVKLRSKVPGTVTNNNTTWAQSKRKENWISSEKDWAVIQP